MPDVDAIAVPNGPLLAKITAHFDVGEIVTEFTEPVVLLAHPLSFAQVLVALDDIGLEVAGKAVLVDDVSVRYQTVFVQREVALADHASVAA